MPSDLPSAILGISGFPFPSATPSASPTSSTSSISSTSSAPATTTSSTSTSSGSSSTNVSRVPQQTPPADSSPWDNMRDNTHHAIIASGIIGLIVLVGLGLWFVRQRRRRAQAPPNGGQPGMLPLYNLQDPPNPAGTMGRRAPAGDAPPSYEEVVPAHLRVATGPPRILHVGEGEDGMIADGKTPLSEIPFEDVMLEPSSSSSSMSSANQAFQNVHHNGMGDTRGHTNS